MKEKVVNCIRCGDYTIFEDGICLNCREKLELREENQKLKKELEKWKKVIGDTSYVLGLEKQLEDLKEFKRLIKEYCNDCNWKESKKYCKKNKCGFFELKQKLKEKQK